MFVGIDGEIQRRKLRRDYPAFVEFVNKGFLYDKFPSLCLRTSTRIFVDKKVEKL